MKNVLFILSVLAAVLLFGISMFKKFQDEKERRENRLDILEKAREAKAAKAFEKNQDPSADTA